VNARRAGFSLLELTAALTLTLVLATLLCGLLIVQVRLARRVADRARTADAVRTARVVLDGEARRGTARDVRAMAPDSFAARSFRGVGLVCAATDSLRVHVRYRGDRLPDPRKDSLLVVGVRGERTVALADVNAGAAPGCRSAAGEVILHWRAAAPLSDAGVLLVFESGSYYLSGRALRYRLGAEGRQPLTADLFAHPQTSFIGVADDGLRFRLQPIGGKALDVRSPFVRPSLVP
jgi:hypothetical protein